MKDLSSDVAKDNSAVVGSSLTVYQQDIENCDGHGGSGYIEKEEPYHGPAEEQGHVFVGARHLSPSRHKKLNSTRYFIIKSLSHDNIRLSVEKGVWATQVMNEPILEEAFDTSDRVILIFSVNMSGFFQGYAQMMSTVGWRRDNIWSGSSGGSNPWGRSFKVKWLRLHNLPFQKTIYLKNPLNDYKPVKISRDCQELPSDIGEALCDLIDEDEKMKRDEFLLKRPCREYPHPYDYVSSVSSHSSWAGMPALHPFLLYQHTALADGHDAHLMTRRSSREYFPENLPTNSEDPRTSVIKHTQGYPINWQRKRDLVHQTDEKRAIADSVSEEDFLDMVETCLLIKLPICFWFSLLLAKSLMGMYPCLPLLLSPYETYEEYLQMLGRSNKSSTNLALGGVSLATQDPSRSSNQDDDRHWEYPSANWSGSKTRI